MAPSRRLSLRTRLTALAAAGAAVVLGATVLFLYRDLSGELSTAITDELTVRVDDLAMEAESGSPPPSSALVTAQTIDADGRVLEPPNAEPLLTADELTCAANGLIIVDRAVPGVAEHARLLARPITGTGTDPIVGVAATSTATLMRARERLTIVLAVGGPALIAAIAAAAWVLTGAALRPVRRMAREAATISAAQAGRRLPHPRGDDEIAELGSTLNAMLDRIESTIARERTFIDNAAHELRTPIAVLRGEVELAAQDSTDPDAVAAGLRSALEEADRLARLTQDLLTLARADAGQLTPGSDTTELLATARDAVRRVPHRGEVNIEVRGSPTSVRGDADWIGQIVGNLVANAGRHAADRVEVTVTPADGYGRLVVADDGPGFPSELLPRAFSRFARGDEPRGHGRGGAGLGLAIVASLTSAVGGTVDARNGPPLGGAVVQADLPLADR